MRGGGGRHCLSPHLSGPLSFPQLFLLLRHGSSPRLPITITDDFLPLSSSHSPHLFTLRLVPLPLFFFPFIPSHFNFSNFVSCFPFLPLAISRIFPSFPSLPFSPSTVTRVSLLLHSLSSNFPLPSCFILYCLISSLYSYVLLLQICSPISPPRLSTTASLPSLAYTTRTRLFLPFSPFF